MTCNKSEILGHRPTLGQADKTTGNYCSVDHASESTVGRRDTLWGRRGTLLMVVKVGGVPTNLNGQDSDAYLDRQQG